MSETIQVQELDQDKIEIKKFNNLKKILIAGIIAWPFFMFMSVLEVGLISAGGAGAARNYQQNGWLLNAAVFSGLPIAIISLLLAYVYKRKNLLPKSLVYLKIPIYWLVLTVFIQIVLEILSSYY